MPNLEDFDAIQVLRYIVEDAVRFENNFTQGAARTTWIRWPDEGKRFQNTDMFENISADSPGSAGVMVSDISADVVEVGNRRVCPDYCEAHAVAHESIMRSTSS